jgi:hypothetical protein
MRPYNNLSGRVMITAALLLPVSLFAVSTYADEQLAQSAPVAFVPAMRALYVVANPAPVYYAPPPGPAAIDFVFPISIR